VFPFLLQYVVIQWVTKRDGRRKWYVFSKQNKVFIFSYPNFIFIVAVIDRPVVDGTFQMNSHSFSPPRLGLPNEMDEEDGICLHNKPKVVYSTIIIISFFYHGCNNRSTSSGWYFSVKQS